MTQPFIQLADIHRCQLVNILIVNAEPKRLFVQPRSLTLWAYIGLCELIGPLLRSSRSIAFLHHLDIFHYTLIVYKVIGSRMNKSTFYLQAFIRTIENIVYSIFGQIAHWSLQRSVIFIEQGFQLPENHYTFIFTKRSYGTFVHRQRTVGYHLVNIYQVDVAQALASRTSPLRRIERKVVRSWLSIRQSSNRTHQPLAVMTNALCLRIQNHQKPVALLHGRSHTLTQTLIILIRNDGLVYHHFNIVILISVELHAVSYLFHFAVYTNVQITLLSNLLEQLLVMTFTGTHKRSKNENTFSLIIAMN